LLRVKRKQASGCFYLGGGGLIVGLGGAVPTAAAADNRSLTSGRNLSAPLANANTLLR